MPMQKKSTKVKKATLSKTPKRSTSVKKTKELKKIPVFKTEAQERLFWQKHDSSDYIDWNSVQPVKFANLKPSTKAISIRLPETLLYNIKMLANREDVPYQSMMKVLLFEGLKQHQTH